MTDEAVIKAYNWKKVAKRRGSRMYEKSFIREIINIDEFMYYAPARIEKI